MGRGGNGKNRQGRGACNPEIWEGFMTLWQGGGKQLGGEGGGPRIFPFPPFFNFFNEIALAAKDLIVSGSLYYNTLFSK